MAIVVAGSLLPERSLPIRVLAHLEISDKIEHFLSYALLAFLPVLHERPRAVAAIAVGLIGLGVLLEFAQCLVSRDFELGDMSADAVGVFLGMAAGWPLRRFLRLGLGQSYPLGPTICR
jgi:VanZ family protein